MIKKMRFSNSDLSLFWGNTGERTGSLSFCSPLLSILISGKVVVRAGNSEVTIQPGTLGYFSHGYHADDLIAIDKDTLWLSMFVPKGMTNAFEQNESLPVGVVSRTNHPLFRIQLLRALKTVCYGELSCRLKFANLVSAVSKSLYHLASQRRSDSIAVEAKNILHDRYRFDSPGLRELGHKIGANPSHLGREFSRQYGCTTGQYMRQLRVFDVAHNIMSEKNESLSSIALNCGFYDQSHMCKAFKNELGQTPRQFANAPADIGQLIRRSG